MFYVLCNIKNHVINKNESYLINPKYSNTNKYSIKTAKREKHKKKTINYDLKNIEFLTYIDSILNINCTIKLISFMFFTHLHSLQHNHD